MEYTYKCSCSNTLRLTEAIKARFPMFVGTVASDSGTTRVRVEYGISDSDMRILDAIVGRFCLPNGS